MGDDSVVTSGGNSSSNDKSSDHTAPYESDEEFGGSGGQSIDIDSTGRISQQADDSDATNCWICFATPVDNQTALWVRPCKCRGTGKWVHQGCLVRWIDEKQKGNSQTQVSCPQCNTNYIIEYPYSGTLIAIMDSVDSFVYKVCPFVAAGVVLGSLYWCAVTYGAVTVMVVLGMEKGLETMKDADTVVLLLGLPAIPVVLIFCNMIRWEDTVLSLLRKYVVRLPLMKYVLPSFATSLESNGGSIAGTDPAFSIPPLASTVSATRVLCSALTLPTIATVCGKYLFPSMKSSLHRTLVGGLTFLVLKGILKLYHKQQKFVMQRKRRVCDYGERNPALRPSTSTR